MTEWIHRCFAVLEVVCFLALRYRLNLIFVLAELRRRQCYARRPILPPRKAFGQGEHVQAVLGDLQARFCLEQEKLLYKVTEYD